MPRTDVTDDLLVAYSDDPDGAPSSDHSCGVCAITHLSLPRQSRTCSWVSGAHAPLPDESASAHAPLEAGSPPAEPPFVPAGPGDNDMFAEYSAGVLDVLVEDDMFGKESDEMFPGSRAEDETEPALLLEETDDETEEKHELQDEPERPRGAVSDQRAGVVPQVGGDSADIVGPRVGKHKKPRLLWDTNPALPRIHSMAVGIVCRQTYTKSAGEDMLGSLHSDGLGPSVLSELGEEFLPRSRQDFDSYIAENIPRTVTGVLLFALRWRLHSRDE